MVINNWIDTGCAGPQNEWLKNPKWPLIHGPNFNANLYTLTHSTHTHKYTAATAAAAAAPVLTAQQNRLLFVFYLCRHCSMLVPYKTETRVTTYAEIVMLKKNEHEQIERKSEWNFNLLWFQKQSKHKFIFRSAFNWLHDDDIGDDQTPTCNKFSCVFASDFVYFGMQFLILHQLHEIGDFSFAP